MTSSQKRLPVEIIELLSPKLPAVMLNDLLRRMTDWKASGGQDDDAYMYQQSRAAENYYIFHLHEDPKKILDANSQN